MKTTIPPFLLRPPYLKKGDKVAIACPAKKLPGPMDDAVRLLRSWELEVELGATVSASFHQFAGDDALRTRDLQEFIDDESVKAIIAARGGYGTIRIIDQIDLNHFCVHPKWVIGFSDITILHSHLLSNCHVETIHGQMPVNIPDASANSLESLRKALFGEPIDYTFAPHPMNRSGQSQGRLAGGNLSLIIAALGSVSDYSFKGCILFLEDVGEYFYAVDRMMRTLDRAGKLAGLAGLMIGGFTEMKDNDIPFGFTVPELIREIVDKYEYPVCFDFPAGHVPDNQSLILGRELKLSVRADRVDASYPFSH